MHLHGLCSFEEPTWDKGSIAVEGRPRVAGLGFVPPASLLVGVLTKLIGDFLPLDCVLPIVKILVSISTRARTKTHII